MRQAVAAHITAANTAKRWSRDACLISAAASGACGAAAAGVTAVAAWVGPSIRHVDQVLHCRGLGEEAGRDGGSKLAMSPLGWQGPVPAVLPGTAQATRVLRGWVAPFSRTVRSCWAGVRLPGGGNAKWALARILPRQALWLSKCLQAQINGTAATGSRRSTDLDARLKATSLCWRPSLMRPQAVSQFPRRTCSTLFVDLGDNHSLSATSCSKLVADGPEAAQVRPPKQQQQQQSQPCMLSHNCAHCTSTISRFGRPGTQCRHLKSRHRNADSGDRPLGSCLASRDVQSCASIERFKPWSAEQMPACLS